MRLITNRSEKASFAQQAITLNVYEFVKISVWNLGFPCYYYKPRAKVINPVLGFKLLFRCYQKLDLWTPSDQAKRVAESDTLRSSYVRNLIKGKSTPSLGVDVGSIPKIIVQFWNEFPTIPTDVRDCLDSWRQLESAGFRHLIFSDRSADTFISDHYSPEHLHAYRKCYHPAMRSDFFRLCYIYALGGCYIDADDAYTGIPFSHLFDDSQLKLQPLCYDCEINDMIAPDQFTDFEQHSQRWIYYFNNNPLIAGAGHPVIGYALQQATRRLLHSPNPFPEIQSTTGPGNLTATLVAWSGTTGKGVYVLREWCTHSLTVWPLSYRSDARNWRLSNAKPFRG